ARPVVAAELGWMAMEIVDTIFVGRLGAEAIGAVSIGTMLDFAAACRWANCWASASSACEQGWPWGWPWPGPTCWRPGCARRGHSPGANTSWPPWPSDP